MPTYLTVLIRQEYIYIYISGVALTICMPFQYVCSFGMLQVSRVLHFSSLNVFGIIACFYSCLESAEGLPNILQQPSGTRYGKHVYR